MSKCCQGYGETGTLLYNWKKYVKRSSHFGKIVCQFLKTLDTQFLYNSAIPLLVIYPGEIKACLHKDFYAHVHSNFIIANH